MTMETEHELDTDVDFSENQESYSDDAVETEGQDDGGLDGDDSEGAAPELDADDRAGDLGEAEDLEQAQSGGAVPTGNMPAVPQGFSSWEEYGLEAARRDSRQAHDYQQQSQQYLAAQQAEARRQEQAQQQQGFSWNLPHQMDPDLRMAMRLRGTKGYQELPQGVRDRVEAQHSYVNNNWDRWTYDPGKLVDDVVLPRILPALRGLTEQLAELKAAEFRRKHQSDLGSPEDVTKYLDLVQTMSRDPYQASLEMLRMQRALAATQQETRGNKTKSRDRQAQSKSAKGKPPAQGRTKGRRGKRKATLSKKERAMPDVVAQQVIRDLLASGELSQDQLAD